MGGGPTTPRWGAAVEALVWLAAGAAAAAAVAFWRPGCFPDCPFVGFSTAAAAVEWLAACWGVGSLRSEGEGCEWWGWRGADWGWLLAVEAGVAAAAAAAATEAVAALVGR